MLDHISLLPPEYYEIKRKRSRNRKLIIIFSSLFVISITAFIILSIITSGVESELDILEERLELVEEQVAELEGYEAQKEELELMGRALKESIGLNPGLPAVIMEIGKVVPEEVALIRIQAIYDYDKGGTEDEEAEEGEEEEESGKIDPGQAAIAIEGALHSSPEVLSHWADQIRKIDQVQDVQYRYSPSPEPDYLGRIFQEVRMNVAIKIDEPYRQFGGSIDE